MPLKRAIKLINFATEAEIKELLYRQWLAFSPYMEKSKIKSFDQYYKEHRPKKIIRDSRSKDDILQEIYEIK